MLRRSVELEGGGKRGYFNYSMTSHKIISEFPVTCNLVSFENNLILNNIL